MSYHTIKCQRVLIETNSLRILDDTTLSFMKRTGFSTASGLNKHAIRVLLERTKLSQLLESIHRIPHKGNAEQKDLLGGNTGLLTLNQKPAKERVQKAP